MILRSNLRTAAALLLASAPTLTAQGPSASPGAQIIAWWDAAPNAANRAVDITGTTNATLVNGASFGAIPGLSSEAFAFDGVDDHLVSDSDMQGMAGDNWSFEGWVRPTRVGVFQGLVSRLNPASDRAGDFALVMTPDGRLQVRYRTNSSNGNTERIFQTSQIFTAGSTHHVGVTVFNGSSFSIVVDGVNRTLASTSASFGTLPSGGFDRSTFVGCVIPGNVHFQGQMDELTFYDRRLSFDEFELIAQAGNAFKTKEAAPLPAGCVTWYDGETCREHALDRVSLEAAPLSPRNGVDVALTTGIVGDGFDLGSGGGLNPERPILRTTGPFSVEMWVFRRRNNIEEMLYSELNQQGGVPGEFSFRFADGSIRLVRLTGTGNQAEGVSGNLPIRLNVWTHVAAVYAGPGDIRLYVNGERTERTVGNTTSNTGPNQDAGFGVGLAGISSLRAVIDECTLYRSAVTDAEIDAIYRAGRFGKESQSARSLDCRSGTLEDLRLDVTLSQGQTMSPPSLQMFADDLLLMQMTSPAGTFALSPYGILIQAYDPATPPVGIPGIPQFAIDPPSAFFLAGGLNPTPLGPPLFNPTGAQVTLLIPPGIAGVRVRMQGFALSPAASNGGFATTDPIDLQIRGSVSGPGF